MADSNTTALAQLRTLYANQRTYLSYLRTGFAITAVAITFKSDVVILTGLILIIFGIYQYYTTALSVERGDVIFPNKEIPLVFALSGLRAVYYYWTKK